MKKIYNKIMRDVNKEKKGGFEKGLYLESIDYFDK